MELTVAVPLLTLALGVWLGHLFSIGRDRRKEFNEIAARARTDLLRWPDSGEPARLDLGAFHWEILLREQWPWNRARLARARADWEASWQDFTQTDTGDLIYNNEPRNREVTARLLRLIKLK